MSRTLKCVVCLLGFAIILCAQQNTLPSWKETAFPVTVPPRAYAFTKIGDGFLWTFRRTLTTQEQEADAVQLYSLADNSKSLVPFWVDGATTIRIKDATVAEGQTVLLVGSWSAGESSNTALSSGESAEINFLVGKDLLGHSVFNVDTGNFEASRVCKAGDGTVWALGQDEKAEARARPYQLLRRYSMTGELLGSYVDRKGIGPAKLVLNVRAQPEGRPGRSRVSRVILSCGRQSVGTYIGATQTWSEVRLSDGHTQTWTLTLPSPSARITGLVLQDEHTVYASFKVPPGKGTRAGISLEQGTPNELTKPAGNNTNSLVSRGLYALNLGPDSKGVWKEVPGTLAHISDPGSFARLVGSDGSSLLYLRSSDHPDQRRRGPTLVWMKP